jgi:hypothetical protein
MGMKVRCDLCGAEQKYVTGDHHEFYELSHWSHDGSRLEELHFCTMACLLQATTIAWRNSHPSPDAATPS